MDLKVELASQDQYPALYGIMALAGEYMHRVLKLSHWYPFPESEWFIKHCEGKEVFGIYLADQLIGTFNISTIPERYYLEDMSNYWTDLKTPSMYFSAFGILPTFQQQGIGSWVMGEMDNMIQARGYKQVRFDAVNTHAKLKEFYRKNGYRECGVLDVGRAEVMCFDKQF